MTMDVFDPASNYVQVPECLMEEGKISRMPNWQNFHKYIPVILGGTLTAAYLAFTLGNNYEGKEQRNTLEIKGRLVPGLENIVDKK